MRANWPREPVLCVLCWSIWDQQIGSRPPTRSFGKIMLTCKHCLGTGREPIPFEEFGINDEH